MNIRLLFEYDGRGYVGWQKQIGQPSIQAALEDAILRVTGATADLVVAGRTDAGVSALGQIANFHTTSVLPAGRFAAALNAHLPDDIRVHLSEQVDATFSARHDSDGKVYRYRIYNGPVRAPLEPHAWQIRAPIDSEAMRTGARHLIGEHDFNAFRSAQCDAPHARRNMLDIKLVPLPRPPVGTTIDIFLHADAFCRHMCRIIAGTLVELGCGKREPDDMLRILESRDRRAAGITAPPEGLTLVQVYYPRK